MDVEWFRDFIIGIAGAVLIVVLIFLSVIIYSVYRRVRNTSGRGRVVSGKR